MGSQEGEGSPVCSLDGLQATEGEVPERLQVLSKAGFSAHLGQVAECSPANKGNSLELF